MAGIENFAAMLNNMSGDGGNRVGELFNHLTSTGSTAYAQFCNHATPKQSKTLAGWFSTATSEQVQLAARRLNSGKAGDPASFLAWLNGLRPKNLPPEPIPTERSKPVVSDGQRPVSTTDKIRFRCPHCDKPVSVPVQHAGKKGKCPGCDEMLRIPSGAAPSQPATARDERPAQRIVTESEMARLRDAAYRRESDAATPPVMLIRGAEVERLQSYETSPRTCTICKQDGYVVIAFPSGDMAVDAGAEVPSKLAGYCSKCQSVVHLRCARTLRMPGATVFRCPHNGGNDGGVLRSQ